MGIWSWQAGSTINLLHRCSQSELDLVAIIDLIRGRLSLSSGGFLCFFIVFSLARYLGLGSSKGKNQYELFAEGLGATLPSVANSAAEGVFSRLGGNCSTDRCFSTGSHAGTTTKEEKEFSKVQILMSGALMRIVMAEIMRMNFFVGSGDGKKNPSDFLSDVEMAACSWDATYGTDTDILDASMISIFRENLDRDGDVWYWWSCILADVEKLTFTGIKKAFLKRYGAEKNKAISPFNIQNEQMCLQQKKGQMILEYVREDEILSERVPANMNDMLVMEFIRRLAEQESSRQILYDLRDSPEFTFAKALHMVKAWYGDTGISDRFNRFGTASSSQPIVAPMVSQIFKPQASEVVAVHGVASGTIGGASQAKNAMQEAFNQILLHFI